MDTTDIRKGAMLSLGNCHAIIGDGELCVSGLKIPAGVDLKITIIKNKSIVWPMLENDTEIMVIAIVYI